MSTIRIVWGTGGGPTATAATDAALAAAGVHEYNLVTVSSILPAGPAIEVVERAPSLGPPGARLTVVRALATSTADRACAGLGWARTPDGPGVVYEATGASPSSVREEVETGLEAGCALRDRELPRRGSRYVWIDANESEDAVVAAVVLAVLGEGERVMASE